MTIPPNRTLTGTPPPQTLGTNPEEINHYSDSNGSDARGRRQHLDNLVSSLANRTIHHPKG